MNARRSGLIWLLLALPLGWLNAQRVDTIPPKPGTYQLRLFEVTYADTTLPVADAEPLTVTKRRYDRLLRRQQRKHYEGHWLVNGSLGIGLDNYGDYRNRTYTRSTTGEGGRNFILPSGEIIFTERYFGSYYNYDNQDITRSTGIYPRIGLARQSRWGGYFHATAGYYRSRVKLRGDPYDDLADNGIQTVVTSEEDVGTLEIGFQYTFLRRHRFRPYLGFSFFNTVYYHGEERQHVYDVQTRQRGIVSGFRSKEFFPLYPEFALTAGFQFEVTKRLSLGAQIFANEGFNIFIDAPVGVEARYTLK
ncbi:hypothetical protein [Neolewinella antarctica]|uniref:Uncharacterized protein n=1 Tax=Neolewinella antarctica TaxID=442734 RepID=A0ABX0XBU1_9BACT|nr:hypothetical protein [Neolewinella antarctica]NJC26738.1 hypothetical protein [Neolewinella antarctica]